MSDEYRTEIERFINRSVEHLERRGKNGISIIVETTNNKTGKKYRTFIRIEKIEKSNYEQWKRTQDGNEEQH